MKRFLAFTTGITMIAGVAFAASLPLLSGPNTQEPSQIQATLNALIQSINSLVTPNTMAMFNTPRNVLDNGAAVIQTRGTGTATCGTTSGVPATAHAADRWGCIANVTSGAGRMAVITATPSPPLGFTASQKLFRTSGLLTQPICAIQEIPTVKVTALQGRQVVASAWVQALAGLAADNANAFNIALVAGTGTDEGLGTFTASPAITPAFTGVTTVVNQAFVATTAWARYQVSALMPSTATEAAWLICFTPTATGAGTTDGLAFTGSQLEDGSVASNYEFKPVSVEAAETSRYSVSVAEAASGVAQFSGNATATTTCEFSYAFPVLMRAAPTLSQIGTAIGSGTTYKANTATAGLVNITALATKTANTVNAASFTTTSAGMTAGQACTLEGLGGGAISLWSADF